MKKILVVGILTLIIMGSILAAGCTSTTSSTPIPDSVVGTWTLPDGTTVSFAEKFTGVMTAGENKFNFTWTKTDDGKYQVTREDGIQVVWTPNMDGTMTNPKGDILTKVVQSSNVHNASGSVFSLDNPSISAKTQQLLSFLEDMKTNKAS